MGQDYPITRLSPGHTEQYRGQGGKSDEVHKDEVVTEEDGPVVGITCAMEAGAFDETKQNEKLSNNVMIQEEDTTWRGSNYTTMTGISHVEIRLKMLEESSTLGFVTSKVSGVDVVSVYSKEFSDLIQNMGFITTE
jgi:hypothetical protein